MKKIQQQREVLNNSNSNKVMLTQKGWNSSQRHRRGNVTCNTGMTKYRVKARNRNPEKAEVFFWEGQVCVLCCWVSSSHLNRHESHWRVRTRGSNVSCVTFYGSANGWTKSRSKERGKRWGKNERQMTLLWT